MVRSITPPDDCSLLDTKQKTKRFSFNQHSSKNPWEKFESKQQSKDYTKARSNHKPINSTANNLKSSPLNRGFNLENIWSIRNNVPFQSPNQVSSIQKAHPSSYSRYKNVSVADCDRSNENNIGTAATGQNSWNVKTQRFSHNNKKSFEDFPVKDDSGNIDDEFDHSFPSKRQRINSYETVPREVSARTKRAQKFQAAYMKSRGLGGYTTSSQQYSKEEGFGWKKQTSDDEFNY